MSSADNGIYFLTILVILSEFPVAINNKEIAAQLLHQRLFLNAIMGQTVHDLPFHLYNNRYIYICQLPLDVPAERQHSLFESMGTITIFIAHPIDSLPHCG